MTREEASECYFRGNKKAAVMLDRLMGWNPKATLMNNAYSFGLTKQAAYQFKKDFKLKCRNAREGRVVRGAMKVNPRAMASLIKAHVAEQENFDAS